MLQSLSRSTHPLPTSPVFSLTKYLFTLEAPWLRQSLIRICLLCTSIAACASERGTFLKGIGANNEQLLMTVSNRIDIDKKSITTKQLCDWVFRWSCNAHPHPRKMPWWEALTNRIAKNHVLQWYDARDTNKWATSGRPWRLEVSHAHGTLKKRCYCNLTHQNRVVLHLSSQGRPMCW